MSSTANTDSTRIDSDRLEAVFGDALDEKYDESLLPEMDVSRDDCLEGLALLQDDYKQSLDEQYFDYYQYDRVTDSRLTILDLPGGNWASDGYEVGQQVLGDSIEADVVREFHEVLSLTHEAVARSESGVEDTGGYRAVVVYDPTENLDLTALHFSILVNWAYRGWLTRRDIADRLNTSEATVKKYISRRKEKLAVAHNTVEFLEGIEAATGSSQAIETTCKECGKTSDEVMTHVGPGTPIADALGYSGEDVCDSCIDEVL